MRSSLPWPGSVEEPTVRTRSQGRLHHDVDMLPDATDGIAFCARFIDIGGQ